ncbi:hypothetical protein D3C87_1807290 [compost metagenome]
MQVYRYEPSPAEYYVFTTEQSEKVKVQQYTEKYGSIKKAVATLVAEQKNN